MAPEPLVTVTTFGDPELAEPDFRKLQKAGLDAYLGGEYHRHHGPVELRVPRSQVPKAFELLGFDPPDSESSSPAPAEVIQVCPECGSGNTRRLPPYAFRVLIGSLVLLGMTILLGQAWIGLAGLVVAWVVVAMWLSRYSGRYRCQGCGRDWKPDD